jgi:hypothetical protein
VVLLCVISALQVSDTVGGDVFLLASVNDTAYRNNPHAAEELKQDI